MEIETVKPEEQKVVQSQPESRAHLTAEEAALQSLISKEGEEWLGLTDADIGDFSLANDPYPLPEGCDSLKGEFAFRYCERDPKRVQELKSSPVPFKWWICNAVNCPALARHCDSITGAIHMRDQMLMIKPRWMMERAKALMTASDDAKFKSRNPNERDGERDGNYEYRAGDKVKFTGRDKVLYDEGEPGESDAGEMSIEA